MQTSFYSRNELGELGLKHVGENAKISRFAKFYSPETIEVGDDSRVDDFCIVSGRVIVGHHVHVSAYVGLYGGAGITLQNFSTVSGRTLIYSVSDDYSGDTMTNPTIDDRYRSVKEASVDIGEYAIIGAGCVVLPGVKIGEGCAVGAMSLVRNDLAQWVTYAGVPAKRIGERSRNLLFLAAEMREKR